LLYYRLTAKSSLPSAQRHLRNRTLVRAVAGTAIPRRAILQHPSIPGLVFARHDRRPYGQRRGCERYHWMVTCVPPAEINSITVHSNPNLLYFELTTMRDDLIRWRKNFPATMASAVMSLSDLQQCTTCVCHDHNAAVSGGGFSSQRWRVFLQPPMRNMPPRLRLGIFRTSGW
jgi:hypothetical protein